MLPVNRLALSPLVRGHRAIHILSFYLSMSALCVRVSVCMFLEDGNGNNTPQHHHHRHILLHHHPRVGVVHKVPRCVQKKKEAAVFSFLFVTFDLVARVAHKWVIL